MFTYKESFPCGDGVHTITVQTDSKEYAERVAAFCRTIPSESSCSKKRTNGEKYTSSKERAQAFNDYCEKHARCEDCKLLHCPSCELTWVDLEAEEQE